MPRRGAALRHGASVVGCRKTVRLRARRARTGHCLFAHLSLATPDPCFELQTWPSTCLVSGKPPESIALPTLLFDLRYTLRQLRRAPGFTATALLTLALGIGATTAMYSLVRATLLEALPYPHPAELVGIGFSNSVESPNAEQTGETADLLLRNAKSFSGIGIADDGPYGQNLAVPNSHASTSSQTVRSLRVSSGYLPTIGVPPLLGRTFTATEDTPGTAPTAVLSSALWRTAFAADPNVVGRTLHLNGDLYTIVGVMPASFATADAPDLWQPLQLSSKDPGYIGTNYQLIARLKPGITPAQARTELPALTATIYRQFPSFNRWNEPGRPQNAERLWPLQQIVVANARPSLLALSAAVLAVLLMACLNLAGLVTARSAVRRPEISLRSALGASRLSTLRLLLTESFVLAFAGSTLGLVFVRLNIPLLIANSPIDIPTLHVTAIDLPATLFAIAAGCATTLLFGVLPAVGVFRQTSPALGNTRTAGASAPQQRLGRTLLVAQVALATTLLSVGAVLLGTFLHLRAIPSGIRSEHLYALQVNLKGSTYNSSLHTQQFITAVESHLRTIPGVASVATVNGLPLDRGLNNSGGPADHPEQIAYAESRFVTPGYLHTSGMMLLAGNDISVADSATTPPVALINERAARKWFPDHSPIGETILDCGEKRRVVGVVADVHDSSLATAAGPTVYVPYAQTSDATVKMLNGWFPTTFLLYTDTDLDLARAAAAAVSAVDPEVPVSKFASMQTFVDHTVAAPRFFSFLAGAFAGFALLLTVIGLYGLLSFQVSARTREIGVRMAVGAQRWQILTFILRSGLALTAIGLVVGTLGSFAIRRVLASFLANATDVRTTDLTPLLTSQTTAVALAAAAMLLAAFAATLIPARRAASVEPTTALRAE